LYGTQHPYGGGSNVENIRAVTQEDLVTFFKQAYINAKCAIFAAGKLPADFENLLNTHFGDLRLNENLPSILHKAETASDKKARVINDPKGVQGAIRIARPFPNRHHPDFKKVIFYLGVFLGQDL
jgi:zinc protease